MMALVAAVQRCFALDVMVVLDRLHWLPAKNV